MNKASETPSITISRENGRIWSHIRQKWLAETPEERVRQDYLCILVNEYAFSVEQMKEEESVTGRGSGQARADFIVWRTRQEKTDDKSPLIVVECKSDNVTIKAEDYYQGDHYAAAAFDEIAKVLFVKTWVEREMRRKRQRQNLFAADWLDTQLGEDPLQELFRQTKSAYHADQIFDDCGSNLGNYKLPSIK